MIDNYCPKCKGYNIELTTGGVRCLDCNYPLGITIHTKDSTDFTEEDRVKRDTELGESLQQKSLIIGEINNSTFK